MVDHGKQADPGSTSNNATAHSGSADAESLKQQGRDTMHDVSEAAQQQAENLYNQQRDTAADQTHKFTSVFNKMADEFDNQQQPYFSQQARKLAGTVDRFSDKLRDKDLKSLCHEAQSFSRREPALFFGGAIAAGFLVTRFLRSSGQHSHSSHGQSPSSGQSYQSSGAYSSHSSPTPGNPSDGIMRGSSPGATQGPTRPGSTGSGRAGSGTLGTGGAGTPQPGANNPGSSSSMPGTTNSPAGDVGSVNKPGGPGRF